MSILPSRYRLENVRRAFSSPGVVLGELNRWGNRVNRYVHAARGPPDGVDVVAADWDTLLILDGCRYDAYAEQSDLGGDLRAVTSPAGESWAFMEASFVGRSLHDTVYVTANPHAYKLDDGIFHHVENVLDDGWDPDLRTVPPETVATAAREAHERFPHKRLVVHFMQPHFPFIGETGRRIDQGGIDLHREKRGDERPVWSKLMYGLLDDDTVRRAYRENLDLVLDVVDDLVDDLDGRTVVTADHGNLIGDRLSPIPTRGYGHPPGLYPPELVTVPWEVLEGDRRREVRSDPPLERERPSADVVEDRLRNLGYKA